MKEPNLRQAELAKIFGSHSNVRDVRFDTLYRFSK
jgi:hypothetical protein